MSRSATSANNVTRAYTTPKRHAAAAGVSEQILNGTSAQYNMRAIHVGTQ